MIEHTMSNQADFLAACRDLLGDTYVLTLDADMAPFLTDWRDRFTGKALAVLRPATVEQVAGVLRACAQWQVPVVPQGGNTGLVLGSIPDAAGTAIVLSLARLNSIRALDPVKDQRVAVDPPPAINGPTNHERPPDDIIDRHEAIEARVGRVVPVVAHDPQ